jgi:hypothetical protein
MMCVTQSVTLSGDGLRVTYEEAARQYATKRCSLPEK